MKRKKYARYLFGVVVLFLIILPFATHAQDFNQSVSIPNPFNCGGAGGDCTLLTLLTAILTNIIMPIAGVACVVWVIWAGFKFVQAKGNPQEIKDAKQNLLWSLIGVGVILAATGISEVLQATIKTLLTK